MQCCHAHSTVEGRHGHHIQTRKKLIPVKPPNQTHKKLHKLQ